MKRTKAQIKAPQPGTAEALSGGSTEVRATSSGQPRAGGSSAHRQRPGEGRAYSAPCDIFRIDGSADRHPSDAQARDMPAHTASTRRCGKRMLKARELLNRQIRHGNIGEFVIAPASHVVAGDDAVGYGLSLLQTDQADGMRGMLINQCRNRNVPMTSTRPPASLIPCAARSTTWGDSGSRAVNQGLTV